MGVVVAYSFSIPITYRNEVKSNKKKVNNEIEPKNNQFLPVRFVRIDVHSPDLYRLCVPNVDANETCVQYPCRNASLVSLLSNLNEIEVCSWRKISVSILF